MANKKQMRSFEEVWAEKEAEGYQYGHDALEQVRFGWELCQAEYQHMTSDVVTRGPVVDLKNPKDNRNGHQWNGKVLDEKGYATCSWCGCVENTIEASKRCPEAYLASCGSGPVKWYRKSKWLPPDGKKTGC